MNQSDASTKTTPDFLYQAQAGFYAYCTLKAAFDNAVFDQLQEPATCEELARRLDRSPVTVARLLEALLVLGLVCRTGEAFRNTPLAALYCESSSPLCQRALFEHTHATFGAPFYQSTALLRLAEQETLSDPLDSALGVAAGEAFVLPTILEDTLDRITGLNNFAQATSLLDLGAGPGLFGMAVAKARPDMRVSLLDRPQVVWHARSVARRRGMEDKLHFLEGDMFQGGLSGQYDIIFASDCLYAARNQLAEFFCTLKDHLTPGGAVVLRHVETTHDATAPRANALLNLGAELIGFGEYMFTTGDIPKALRAAGFSLISSAPQEHVTHLYTIHTAYK